MFTYRLYDGSARSTLVHRLVSTVGVLVACLGSASQGFAGLINSSYSLRLTAPVADGASTSTEQYESSGIIYDAAGHTNLPNTISPTPSPNPFNSTAGRVNRVVEPTPLSDTNDGRAIIWIKGPLNDPNNVFVNDLDPTQLVELALTLDWGTLPPLEKIVVSDLRLDKGIFHDPVSVSYTGLGTPASPLTILARFDPADVESGVGNFVKVQFDFDTMIIPEPGSLALMGLAGIGFVSRLGRRRNG